ncbi:MAG TPA: phosphate ABC transporter ATP-binding protein, partial [Clostridiales bacterium]|nr:phosphate ABC transporter ATP-binding protein [Clostridiales bacterium]
MNCFTIENLNLYYGTFQALRNVDLSVEEKNITALIGP